MHIWSRAGIEDYKVLFAFSLASAVSWLHNALIWLEPAFGVARAGMNIGVTLSISSACVL